MGCKYVRNMSLCMMQSKIALTEFVSTNVGEDGLRICKTQTSLSGLPCKVCRVFSGFSWGFLADVILGHLGSCWIRLVLQDNLLLPINDGHVPSDKNVWAGSFCGPLSLLGFFWVCLASAWTAASMGAPLCNRSLLIPLAGSKACGWRYWHFFMCYRQQAMCPW